ncbi:SDR family oxidoreductase [Desmospora profundinema]|uniref:Uncharacterized protein YbjT (DUF2867 family) n=1 Tax=Desmospora profundinema TaxID=1571184 RepID=A0ABU1IPY9_9BACL|nr:SDR family oxidoreductase [Desmospora profundinema]MDR6226004.1 uncharacterized protein YbjT (DUF2867 family) [Desmospora profundinema]
MRILVIGANGQIGQQVVKRLASAGHEVRAMIRDPEHAARMEELGGHPVIADLEKDFSHAVQGVGAIYFTAGSGAHTGPDKTLSVDRDGAIRSIEEAEQRGVERYIMLSSLRSQRPEEGPEKIRHYLEAKKAADERLMKTDLNYTIVRPGRLSNEEGTGQVALARNLPFYPDPIPRADVAQVLAMVLEQPATYRTGFDLLPGETPIPEAVRSL